MSRNLLGLVGLAAATALSAAPAAASPTGSQTSYPAAYYYTPHAALQVSAPAAAANVAYASQSSAQRGSYYTSYTTAPANPYAAYGAYGPSATYGSYAPSATSSAYGSDPLFGSSGSAYGDPSYRPQPAAVPRQVVSYNTRHAPGTIVVSTEERRLYYVLGNGQAISYGIGVGRPGFEWAGTQTVTRKREWPDWRPPAEMLARRPDLPRYMPGGPDNPLGARAMYLGNTLYRIHGSNEPETIGQAVSSGCIRMTNEDVIDLYERVKVGSRVVVL